MTIRREVVVGLLAFAIFAAAALTVGMRSGDATIRSFSLLVAVGAGGSMSVMVGLAYHLALGPRGARYEPILGEDGAWGVAEMDDEAR